MHDETELITPVAVQKWHQTSAIWILAEHLTTLHSYSLSPDLALDPFPKLSFDLWFLLYYRICSNKIIPVGKYFFNLIPMILFLQSGLKNNVRLIFGKDHKIWISKCMYTLYFGKEGVLFPLNFWDAFDNLLGPKDLHMLMIKIKSGRMRREACILE